MNMGPDHDRWEDAAGAYALNAMPEDETQAYEAHLAECPACRAEAAELRVAAHALPLSTPALRPPPALKARIMAEVEREAALLASAGEPRREPVVAEKQRRSWRDRFRLPMPALALACTTLIAGLLGGAVLFGGTSAKTVQFAGGNAELELTDDGATIVASNLAPPPAGNTYMDWLMRPGKSPERTWAMFTPRRDGSATASVTGDMDGVEAVLINQEPLGGSTTPTSPVLMTASLT
jgi:anti-sigma factor RsiW